jgi:hypothetical protein
MAVVSRCMIRNHSSRILTGVAPAVITFVMSCGSSDNEIPATQPLPVQVDLVISTLPDVGAPASAEQTLVRVTVYRHLCGNCSGPDAIQAEHVRVGPPGAIEELPWDEASGSFQETRRGYDANYSVEVDLSSRPLHFDATGPALHTFSIDPSPPGIAVPAMVRWTPSRDPSVHVGIVVSGAGSTRGPLDDGVGPDSGSKTIPASVFAARGDYRIEVARSVDLTTTDPGGNRFVKSVHVQVGLNTTIL